MATKANFDPASEFQRCARFWYAESRRSIAAIELAIENGLTHYLPQLIEEANEYQHDSAIYYRRARNVLGIHD